MRGCGPTEHRARGRGPSGSHHGGFSLVELIIVTAILGIIASVALPAWSAYSIRARHASAIARLNAMSVALEQYYSENQTYEANIAMLRLEDNDKWYQFILRFADTTGYQLEAVPTPNNAGAAMFRLDNRGRLQHRLNLQEPWLPGWP